MSYEVLDRVLSLVVLLTFTYFMLVNGTEKAFKYYAGGERRLVRPRNTVITVTGAIFILALFVDAIKGVTLKDTYIAVVITVLLTYLSKVMFEKGLDFGLNVAEKQLEKLIKKHSDYYMKKDEE